MYQSKYTNNGNRKIGINFNNVTLSEKPNINTNGYIFFIFYDYLLLHDYRQIAISTYMQNKITLKAFTSIKNAKTINFKTR